MSIITTNFSVSNKLTGGLGNQLSQPLMFTVCQIASSFGLPDAISRRPNKGYTSLTGMGESMIEITPKNKNARTTPAFTYKVSEISPRTPILTEVVPNQWNFTLNVEIVHNGSAIFLQCKQLIPMDTKTIDVQLTNISYIDTQNLFLDMLGTMSLDGGKPIEVGFNHVGTSVLFVGQVNSKDPDGIDPFYTSSNFYEFFNKK